MLKLSGFTHNVSTNSGHQDQYILDFVGHGIVRVGSQKEEIICSVGVIILPELVCLQVQLVQS
jgi:hypothetical protein